MKFWKLFVLALAVCLLGTCLLACGEGADESTSDSPVIELPIITLPNEAPETTEPETTEFVCEHPNMTETVLVEASCTAVGKIQKKCEDCDFMEEIMTDFAHEDTSALSEALGVNESTCSLCGDRAVVVKAGKRVKLSAYCEGELAFSVAGAPAHAALEVLVDGETTGTVSFDEAGKATVSIEGLAKGGHSVVFVNNGASELRIKNDKIEGYFNRPGAVYVQVFGKRGVEEYPSFDVYTMTSDPSEEYFICYHFTYKYSTDVNTFKANSCTNIGSYRLNGADLCRITEVDEDSIQKQVVRAVLGGGEISFAIMQANSYTEHLAEGAKGMTTDGSAADFIGGYHGDEWIDEVTLIADGEVIDLKSAEAGVYPCSTVTFDLDTTMYAWGTSKEGSRGLPVIDHIQNFVLDSTGVKLLQTVNWLEGNFRVKGGYMPMFTMMCGKLENRLVDTMRAYDVNGNFLSEYKMPDTEIEKQTSVMSYSNAGKYEYFGDKGVSSWISFKNLSKDLRIGGSYIALRPATDNKLYVSSGSVNGTAVQGEQWVMDTQFMIDYVKPTE